MNLEFFRWIFEKYSNIQHHDNLPSGVLSCCMRADGHRDGYDEAISGFSQFYERVFKKAE